MAERAWVKLWESWWTTVSHAHVGPDGLLIGCVLMSAVRWRTGDADAWAELEGGTPIPTAVLAARAQLPTKRAEVGLERLRAVGTIDRRLDGAWGFRKFGRWQESADAARKRKQSPRKTSGSSAEVPREAEGEAEGEADPVPPGQGAGAREAELVVERIVAHRARLRLSELTARERDPKHILARLRDGVPVADLLEVVEIRAAEAERDAGQAGWLSATSPFSGPNLNGRPGGWSVSRQKLDTARRAGAMPRVNADEDRAYRETVARIRREQRREGAA